ncbi:membrane protein [Clostridium novyi A str. 4552]|uniref:Membrane protein n=1 Tax=Clostridium novyi A str. 4552 TaxID=1444289 RepID=A0A0A0I8Z9_CLONO|nr:TIGR04086 family membrane protein [Clostridium novyi]KGM97043.1 membrane protein [Clostridium novyi A str. 4552]
MENRGNAVYVGQGVLRGFFLTLTMLIIYSIVTYFTKFNSKVDSVFFVVVTALSVMYGTLYAVKKIKKKGWITGLLVSIFYILIVFLVSAINGRGFTISSLGILRMFLAIFVGTLSGMLGVNM